MKEPVAITKPVLAPVMNVRDFTGDNLDGSVLANIDWRHYLVTEEPKDTNALLRIQDTPVWTKGNHLLIIGKKKTRKTLFVIWLISQYIKQGGKIDEVLICDTEQGLKHVWKVREKIHRMTGEWINILALRGLNARQRKDIISQAVAESDFKAIIIDGIRDLLSNINDPDQCTELIVWIEHLTVTHNLCIINILHQNKTDNAARGHLGSELLNKAEMTIEMVLDEKAECTVVKCESSRDMPFASFAFKHDVNGLPEIVSMPVKGKVLSDDEQKSRLRFAFNSRLLKYNELITGIMEHFEVGKNKAGHLKGLFERNGWIVKNGRDKCSDTVYKLMVSALNSLNSEQSC